MNELRNELLTVRPVEILIVEDNPGGRETSLDHGASKVNRK
jgi:hypothetical protein